MWSNEKEAQFLLQKHNLFDLKSHRKRHLKKHKKNDDDNKEGESIHYTQDINAKPTPKNNNNVPQTQQSLFPNIPNQTNTTNTTSVPLLTDLLSAGMPLNVINPALADMQSMLTSPFGVPPLNDPSLINLVCIFLFFWHISFLCTIYCVSMSAHFVYIFVC